MKKQKPTPSTQPLSQIVVQKCISLFLRTGMTIEMYYLSSGNYGNVLSFVW